LGKVENGFKKGRHFFEIRGKYLENGFSQNFKGIKKRGRRLWECGVHRFKMFM